MDTGFSGVGGKRLASVPGPWTAKGCRACPLAEREQSAQGS